MGRNHGTAILCEQERRNDRSEINDAKMSTLISLRRLGFRVSPVKPVESTIKGTSCAPLEPEPPEVEITGYLFLDSHYGSTCTGSGGRGIKNGLTEQSGEIYLGDTSGDQFSGGQRVSVPAFARL